MSTAQKLLVLDIDNTVFNWVEYYATCMEALLGCVHGLTRVPLDKLYEEARQVFEREQSIEYPFVIQELPSLIHLYASSTEQLLTDVVEPGRKAFNAAAKNVLLPYDDVVSTLRELRTLYPMMPIIALTDAPRYVAMWKLNKLGLLPYFHAVYGLADPRIPIDPASETIKVDPEILRKHLRKHDFGFTGRIRILPDDYEKPGTKGLKTVLMDFDMEPHRNDVLWVGDNLRKDVGLGRKLGVQTAWARYGTKIRPEARSTLLKFSPTASVAKNVALDPADSTTPQADVTLDQFSDILSAIKRTLFPS